MHFAVFGVRVGEVVLHVFWQQMTAIAGSVNQYVGRGRCHRAIENGLQSLVATFTILEAQVIAKDDEFFGAAGHHIDNVWQVSEVFLVHFNEAQALWCVGVQAGFDEGRFASPPRAR